MSAISFTDNFSNKSFFNNSLMDGLNLNNSSMNITSSVCSNGGIMTKTWDTYTTTKVIIEVFVVSLLVLFGFVGNALSVAVLCKDQDRKNATNWLLQTLAVVDTIYLFTCIFIQTLNCIDDHTHWIPGLKNIFPYLEPYIWAFGSMAQTATVWMVLLVTTDRYIAICKPLNTQLRSIKRAKIAVFIVALLSVAYNIPRFFEREIIWKFNSCTNTTMVITQKTAFRGDKYYFLVYKTMCYFIFRSLGPLCLLIFLNFQLISALRMVHRRQKEMTKRHKNRNENITTMLVAVVTVFIICEIPDSILRILYTVHIYSNPLNIRSLRYFNIATNMLLTINSSINFIIYCLIGKKFRRILNSMCCGSRIGGVIFEASETEPLTMKSTVNTHTVVPRNSVNYNNITANNNEVPL